MNIGDSVIIPPKSAYYPLAEENHSKWNPILTIGLVTDNDGYYMVEWPPDRENSYGRHDLLKVSKRTKVPTVPV